MDDEGLRTEANCYITSRIVKFGESVFELNFLFHRLFLFSLLFIDSGGPANFLFSLCLRETYCFCFPLGFDPFEKGKPIAIVNFRWLCSSYPSSKKAYWGAY